MLLLNMRPLKRLMLRSRRSMVQMLVPACRGAPHTCVGHEMLGKRLRVAYSRPKGEAERKTNVYVAHLPPDTTQQSVLDTFNSFGKIIETSLLHSTFAGAREGHDPCLVAVQRELNMTRQRRRVQRGGVCQVPKPRVCKCCNTCRLNNTLMIILKVNIIFV